MAFEVEEGDADLMGPGMDLALALAGVLILVVVIVFVQTIATVRNKTAVISNLQSRIAGFEKQVGELEGKLRLLPPTAAQNLDLAAELKRLRDNVRSKDAEIAKLRTDLAAAERQANDATIDRDKEKQRAAMLETSLRAANEQLLELKKLQDRVRLLTEESNKLRTERDAERQRASSAETSISASNKVVADLQTKLNDRPPLISISDENLKAFDPGSARVRPELSGFLNGIVKTLYSYREKYGAQVIEVVGHTDEVYLDPNRRNLCNLDQDLLNVLNRRAPPEILGPCDNVGLGMARAVAVVGELRRLGLGRYFTLLPLSAGQTTDVNERLADGSLPPVLVAGRRRIELRMRRPTN